MEIKSMKDLWVSVVAILATVGAFLFAYLRGSKHKEDEIERERFEQDNARLKKEQEIRNVTNEAIKNAKGKRDAQTTEDLTASLIADSVRKPRS